MKVKVKVIRWTTLSRSLFAVCSCYVWWVADYRLLAAFLAGAVLASALDL